MLQLRRRSVVERWGVAEAVTILLLDEERREGEDDVQALRRLMDERPGQILEVLVSAPIDLSRGATLDGEGRLIIGSVVRPGRARINGGEQ